MFAEAEESWQEASIWDDVPAERKCDIFVCSETISIIPEIIFRVHVFKIENSIFSTKDNLVPENNLKQELEFDPHSIHFKDASPGLTRWLQSYTLQ